MNRFIDADQALAKLDQTPVVVHYLGRDWTLYSAMPAQPVFDLMRIEKSGRSQDDLSRGELLAIMSKMVPREVFDGWLDGGVTMDEVTVLLNRVIATYNGEDAAEDPKPGPTASRKAGK